MTTKLSNSKKKKKNLLFYITSFILCNNRRQEFVKPSRETMGFTQNHAAVCFGFISDQTKFQHETKIYTNIKKSLCSQLI